MAEDEDRNYNAEDGFIVTVGEDVVWDGELRGLMLADGRDYAKHFDTEAPDLEALEPDQWEAARAALKKAIATDTPFESDEDFQAALEAASDAADGDIPDEPPEAAGGR